MPIRFQVDPDFYDHPKSIDLSDAAVALWTRAGSYCAAKLTNGFVAQNALALLSKTPAEAADELRRRGLWHRVKGGFQFHQWDERNLTKERVTDDRKADRERKRREREKAKADARKSGGQNESPQVEGETVRPDSGRTPEGIQEDSDRNPGVSVSVSVSGSVSGSGPGAARAPYPDPNHPGPEPPRRCQEHQYRSSTDPCSACFEQRRTHGEWTANHNEWLRTAPRCGVHPGEIAINCRLCASERKARGVP